MDHLNLEVLRTFISIINLNGFNKAAEKVHRSESAISMQMKRLEELTGQTLFEKRGKKHILTNQGEILLSYAKKMLDLNDEALLILKESKLKGDIRVGIQQDFVESLFPNALFKFTKTYPEVIIDLKVDTSDELQKQLLSGKLDIAIYLAKEEKPELDTAILGTLPLQWIYSPSTTTLPDGKSPISLSVLGPNCKIRQLASFALNDAGISWRIVFSTSSLSTTWGAVNAGIGITARTAIGLPNFLKTVPDSVGLPKLPSVNAYLCTTIKEDSSLVLSLKKFLMTAIEEKELIF